MKEHADKHERELDEQRSKVNEWCKGRRYDNNNQQPTPTKTSNDWSSYL
jgi:hypothetical protein